MPDTDTSQTNDKTEDCYLCKHGGSHDFCQQHQRIYRRFDVFESFSYVIALSFVWLQHSFTLWHATMKMGGVFAVSNNRQLNQLPELNTSNYLLAKDTCISLFCDGSRGFCPVNFTSCNCVSEPFSNGAKFVNYNFLNNTPFYRASAVPQSYISPEADVTQYQQARENVLSDLQTENHLTNGLLLITSLLTMRNNLFCMNLDILNRDRNVYKAIIFWAYILLRVTFSFMVDAVTMICV
jgi:hypothetical protein